MKRRIKGEGSFAQRPDGRWQGRITYQGETVVVTDADKDTAFEKWEQAKKDLRKGEYVKPVKQTLGEWIVEWMNAYKRRSVSARTFQTYAQMYNLYIEPNKLSKMDLQKIRHSHIQKWVNELADAGLAEGTVRLAFTVVHGALKRAAHPTLKLIRSSPSNDIDFPKFKGEKKRRREAATAMTAAEQSAFESACIGHRLGDTLLLMLYTGMRPGEAVGLTWASVGPKNINLSGKRQKVAKVGDDMAITGYETKDDDFLKSESGKRVIPIIAPARAVLARLKGKHTTYVCVDEDQQPTEPEYLYRQMERICTAAGIKSYSPHKLRHTFATRCIESGMKPKTLQKILGHSTLSQTMDTYAHVMQESLSEDMAIVESRFKKAP